MNQEDSGITKLGCVNHDCEQCKAQRTWMGLTDEDLAWCNTEEYKTARYWEAKLKEKNT